MEDHWDNMDGHLGVWEDTMGSSADEEDLEPSDIIDEVLDVLEPDEQELVWEEETFPDWVLVLKDTVESYGDGPELEKAFFENWACDKEPEESEESEWSEESEETEESEGTQAEENNIPITVHTDDFESYCEKPEAVLYFRKLIRALRKDDCNRFVELIKREKRVGTVRRAGIIFHPLLLLYLAVDEGAVDCTLSMLKGDADLETDVNKAPNVYDPQPLIVAATKFNPEMVNLLADNGAEFYTKCLAPVSPYYEMSPLEAAIYSLQLEILWSLCQSVDEFTCSLKELFYSLRDKERELLTISIIMRKAPVQQTHDAISSYVGKVNIVGLAILLFVDATFEHLGRFKQYSREAYLSLVDLVGATNNFVATRTMDKQQAVNAVKFLLKTFFEENFEGLTDCVEHFKATDDHTCF